MQKLRLQNVYNKDTNSFDRDNFELRESEKTITGKVSITSKKNDKYISKSIPFVAFKSQINSETELALRSSKGKTFEADYSLSVDSFEADGKDIKFFRLVINEARFQDIDSQDKAVSYSSDSLDEEIPF